jgi:hypothetical protein
LALLAILAGFPETMLLPGTDVVTIETGHTTASSPILRHSVIILKIEDIRDILRNYRFINMDKTDERGRVDKKRLMTNSKRQDETVFLAEAVYV